MLRTFSLVAIGLLLCLVAFPQSKITVGQPYKVIDAASKYYFTVDGEILTVKLKRSSIILQKINANTLKFEKARVFKEFPFIQRIEHVVKLKNHVYVFYSDNENNEEVLYAREIDVASCSFKPAKKILSLNTNIVGKEVIFNLSSVTVVFGNYEFYYSYDKSSMLIRYRLKPKQRSDNKNYDIIGMHVFTPELQETWSNLVKMPYTEKKMDNLDYSVDAKGNAYIVARVYNDDSTEEKKRGEDNPNYRLEILKIEKGTGSVSSAKVDIKDKFVKSIWLQENAQGQMVCAGYYNNGEKADNVDGVVMFTLDASGRVNGVNMHEIPVDILTQNAREKEKRKTSRKAENDEAEANDLHLKNIEIQKDGSVIISGEQRYMRSRRTVINGQSSDEYRYLYNDILATKLDPNGKLVWMRKLPKRQESSSSSDLSYYYLNEPDAHYFLFVDKKENINLSTTEVPATYVDGQHGFFTAYKVDDKTGNVEKLTVFDIRDVKGLEIYQFYTERIFRTGPREFVFEAYKKKKEDVLVRVELPR